MRTIKICNPTAPPPVTTSLALSSVAHLAGARVSVINNGWMSMTLIAQRLAERLPADYGVESVRVHVVEPNCGASEEVLESIANEANMAVVGLANCGGCTSWSVQNQIDLLQRGVYSVLLVTERYKKLAEVIWRGRGMADAPYIVLPVTEATEYGAREVMDEIAESALRGVAQLLALRRAA